MVEPITTLVIVQLAFQAFLNSEAGKAAVGKASEVLTEKVLNQMGELRQKIWNRLRGKSAKMAELEQTIEQTQQITPAQLEDIAAYLRVEMNDDEPFAAEVKQLAEQIVQEISIDQRQGRNLMNVFGGTGQQFNNDNINAAVQQGNITNNNYYGQPPAP